MYISPLDLMLLNSMKRLQLTRSKVKNIYIYWNQLTCQFFSASASKKEEMSASNSMSMIGSPSELCIEDYIASGQFCHPATFKDQQISVVEIRVTCKRK
ncbi:UNVERIFIED_CONTAM: hypothetical protein NCL1_30516 [Trichonephila clavipes]